MLKSLRTKSLRRQKLPLELIEACSKNGSLFFHWQLARLLGGVPSAAQEGKDGGGFGSGGARRSQSSSRSRASWSANEWRSSCSTWCSYGQTPSSLLSTTAMQIRKRARNSSSIVIIGPARARQQRTNAHSIITAKITRESAQSHFTKKHLK